MKYDNRQYPHPVLGLDDSVNGLFTCNLSISSDGEIMKINPKIFIKNDEINKLIEQKKASINAHIYCRATFYRTSTAILDKISEEIEIQAEKLKGPVEVDFLISANEDFNYSSSEFHEDFGGIGFDIDNGDIIGYGGKAIFHANKSPEKLKAISSIMQITADPKKNAPFSIDYDGDRILILVSSTDFESYQSLFMIPDATPLIHSSLIFPALVQVLNFMLNYDESNDFQDRPWYQILKDQIDKIGSDDPLELAQKIIDLPLNRAFSKLEEDFEIE